MVFRLWRPSDFFFSVRVAPSFHWLCVNYWQACIHIVSLGSNKCFSSSSLFWQSEGDGGIRWPLYTYTHTSTKNYIFRKNDFHFPIFLCALSRCHCHQCWCWLRRCRRHFPIFHFWRLSHSYIHTPIPFFITEIVHSFLLHFSFVWKFCVEQVFLRLYLVFVSLIVFFFFSSLLSTFTLKLDVLLHIFVLPW